MLANPKSTSGETIQNSLNYGNRKQDLLIWSIVERINFFVQMKLKKYAYLIFKTDWKLYFKNNEKIPGNLRKIMEISWKSGNPEYGIWF